jgi:predicted nucleic acid-binding protein
VPNYVVLDTDVSSQSYRGRLPAPLVNRLVGLYPCISFVTLGELTKWVELRNWGPANRARMDHWLSGVGYVPHRPEVSQTWGRLAAAAQRRGRPRPMNDMWIAATCITEGLPLATLNIKDFEDFAEHEGLRLVEISER